MPGEVIHSLVVREGARIICNTSGAGTMRHPRRGKRGQNLIEYAIIVAAIAAAMYAMSTYVFRSVQATQQMIQEESTRQ